MNYLLWKRERKKERNSEETFVSSYVYYLLLAVHRFHVCSILVLIYSRVNPHVLLAAGKIFRMQRFVKDFFLI